MFLALFGMFLVYDWPCLHECILQENLLFFLLILGSVSATVCLCHLFTGILH